MKIAASILTTLSDSALITQYQLSGQEIYFSELYRRYYGKVNRYCLKALGNSVDAADMSQEVFLKALEKLPTLRNSELWVAWLFRITRNKVINRHKYEALHRMDSFEERNPDLAEEYEIEEKLEIERKLNVLPQLLQEMPPKQARLLRLKYLEGESIEQLCDELNAKESAIKMRLLRARTSMVKIYEAKYKASA